MLYIFRKVENFEWNCDVIYLTLNKPLAWFYKHLEDPNNVLQTFAILIFKRTKYTLF